jgi:hypothetical protein
MKKISTFIFVHNQDIVVDFLEKNRFNEFEDYKYVFLGNGEIDKIEKLDNIIIARNYEDNIEQYPKMTSYTGWYLLWKYNLIDTEYVNLFEYDINHIKGFSRFIKPIVDNNNDFIGYFPMLVDDPVYVNMTQYSKELIESVERKENIKITDIINELKLKDKNLKWSSSSNSTWKTEHFYNFTEWLSNYIDDIKTSDYCGHIHERSISFYYFMKNLKVYNTTNLMSHLQLNSHGTSPLPKNRFNQLYNNLL